MLPDLKNGHQNGITLGCKYNKHKKYSIESVNIYREADHKPNAFMCIMSEG